MGALISSESSFIYRHHAISCVVGICGINLGVNTAPYNPYRDYGNVLTAAKLLRDYLDIYGTYYLAFKRYKGWSPLGASQASRVMALYISIKD
ncbi:MAG: hypothetical protein ACYDD5_01075 [Sulfuricurvum sp.]